MRPLRKFLPLIKVDEAAHMVWGRCTTETPDSDDEICDYPAAKAAYTKWSSDFLAKTTAAGQDPSMGNIRVMHQLQIGGKAVKLEFHDDTKEIWLGTEPANDEIWKLLKGGFLTGYSQGGGYGWRKQEGQYVRYAPEIGEVSYVDNAANPDTAFEYVKADGSKELVKFAKTKQNSLGRLDESDVLRIAKAVAASLKPATTDKDKPLRARIAKAVGEKGWTREEAMKRVEKVHDFLTHGLEKGMYSVTQMSNVLEDLGWIQRMSAYERDEEGDGSAQPEDLSDLLTHTITCFLDMCEEETSELAAACAAASGKGATAMKVTFLDKDGLTKATKEDLVKHVESLQTSATELEKTAHTLMTNLKKAQEMVQGHHDKAVAMHKAHLDTMTDHIGKCMKALGTPESGSGSVAGGAEKAKLDAELQKARDLVAAADAAADPAKAAAAATAAAAVAAAEGENKPLTKADIDATIAKGIKDGVDAAVAAKVKLTLVGRPGENAPELIKAAAAGATGGSSTAAIPASAGTDLAADAF